MKGFNNMCKKPLLSIIVPLYNEEDYIAKTVESIRNSSFEDFELLLIDDGSTDMSSNICDSLALKDSRIKVIHKKNGGLVSSWKCGVSNAKADYISFVDGDDLVEHRMFEKLYNSVMNYNADIAITIVSNLYQSGKKRNDLYFEKGYYDSKKIEKEIYPKFLNTGKFMEKGMSPSRCGKVIKKCIFEKNMSYCDNSVRFGEDVNVMVPVILDCQSMVLVDSADCDYLYRCVQNSMLNSFNPSMYSQVVKLYNSLIKCLYDKNKCFSEVENQIMAFYLGSIVQCYKNYLREDNNILKMLKNIWYLSTDSDFKKAAKVVRWDKYELKNRIVINCMLKRGIFRRIIIPVLFRYLYRVENIMLEKHMQL